MNASEKKKKGLREDETSPGTNTIPSLNLEL